MGNINSDPKRQTLMSGDLSAGNAGDNQALGYSKGDLSSETLELDNSGGRVDAGIPRSPFATTPASPVYNRFKYYSALRTGYQQLNPSVKGSFLKVPKHVIEPFLYYI